MLSKTEIDRLAEIQKRLSLVSSGNWRNTIRRESASEVATAIRDAAQPCSSLCSEVVVNTLQTPTVQNVVCWMGPAAGEKGDDLLDANFIACAPEDIRWLLNLVERLSAVKQT